MTNTAPGAPPLHLTTETSVFSSFRTRRRLAGSLLGPPYVTTVFLFAITLSILTSAYALAADPSGVPTVKAIQVSSKPEENLITGMGSISCPRSIELGFDDTGVIAQMFVEEGDNIKKGQLIAKLDDSSLRAARIVAEARYKAAQAEVNYFKNELDKKESLFRKQAVSDAEYKKAVFEVEKAEAAATVGKAELQKIDVDLQKKILIAPISGIVAKRFLDVGSPVVPGSNKTILLVQCEDVFADIELGERLFPGVKVGQPVRLKVDALGGKVFEGRIIRIGAEVDKKNRTFIIKVRTENPHFILRQGMFVRAEIVVSEGVAPLSIPKRALLRGGSEGMDGEVFVIKNGVSMKRVVSLGESDGEKIQVTKGLRLGDVVVVEGQNLTKDLGEVNVELLKK
jgi:RND family efflux transporter MFP subunit